jgi:hypothetical protein
MDIEFYRSAGMTLVDVTIGRLTLVVKAVPKKWLNDEDIKFLTDNGISQNRIKQIKKTIKSYYDKGGK